MDTFNVDITIRGNDGTTAVMNYSHNRSAIHSASSVTMALADYSDTDTDLTVPQEFRSYLVSVDVTVHDESACRYCKDA